MSQTFKELLLKKVELESELKMVKSLISDKEKDITEQMLNNGLLKTKQGGLLLEVKPTTKLDGKKPELIEYVKENNMVELIKIAESVSVAELKKTSKEIYDKFAETKNTLKITIEEE